jgi:ribosome maturation factor RimP
MSGPTAGRPADILTGYLDAPLRAAGFDLEDVSVRRAGRQSVVAVTVDREGTLDLDAIADASHLVSDTLDALDAVLPGTLHDGYTLEVTSRGADAPLVLPRHWAGAVGRLVDVRLREGAPVNGRVVSADDDHAVVLSAPKPHKPGARVSAKAPAEISVPYADVIRAVVELEFTSPDGTEDVEAPDELDDIDDDVSFEDDAAADEGMNR